MLNERRDAVGKNKTENKMYLNGFKVLLNIGISIFQRQIYAC